jgi:hypothetical protein
VSGEVRLPIEWIDTVQTALRALTLRAHRLGGSLTGPSAGDAGMFGAGPHPMRMVRVDF